jgi:hypothetical protein
VCACGNNKYGFRAPDDGYMDFLNNNTIQDMFGENFNAEYKNFTNTYLIATPTLFDICV